MNEVPRYFYLQLFFFHNLRINTCSKYIKNARIKFLSVDISTLCINAIAYLMLMYSQGNLVKYVLTYFMPLAFFYTPWKYKKNRCFLMFLEVIKRNQSFTWETVRVPKIKPYDKVRYKQSSMCPVFALNPFHATNFFLSPWKHQKTSGYGLKLSLA